MYETLRTAGPRTATSTSYFLTAKRRGLLSRINSGWLRAPGPEIRPFAQIVR